MNGSYQTGVGIYVDAANIQINGGYGMQYDVLREFACHDGGVPVRLNAYVTYDEERAKRDRSYFQGTNNFFSSLRDIGYKVIIKNFKWYKDDEGNAYAKANADLDMAVDALLQSENLGRVLMATGDGDFVQVVRALQNKGLRVEVIAFDNVSHDLRREADVFISGYLIPRLLPIQNAPQIPWGEDGSRLRGTCYYHSKDGYGFMRYLKNFKCNLWITDSRREDSPYASVYFSDADLPKDFKINRLPNHDVRFEFDITPSTVKKNAMQARNIMAL